MKYYQGKFTPRYPEKYVGDPTGIQARSSWEFRAMRWLDENSSILKWASEEMHVPYISPRDGRQHRYYPDFLIQYKTHAGEIKKAMLEVKPNAQINPPVYKGRKTQRFLTETLTYAVNQAKWAAAKRWCSDNGFDFILLDEYSLDIKKRK